MSSVPFIIPIIKISPDEIKKITQPVLKKSTLNKNDSDSDELDKPEVDYFNEIFISVRKFPKARGYRLPCKIKSFLDLDFFS